MIVFFTILIFFIITFSIWIIYREAVHVIKQNKLDKQSDDNEKDELIFSGKTDKDGKIIIDKLVYGKYYILEKEAPEGYVLNPDKMWFEIKEDGVVVVD